jgi:hypothetical protein
VSTAEVAILVSLLSAVLAAVSLGWQVVVFRKSGYNVKCVLAMGYIEEGHLDSGASFTTKVQMSPQRWAQSAGVREHGGQQFFVTVINSGRAAVWVDSIGLTTKDGVVAAVTDSDEPGLPYRLDSHQTQQWNLPVLHAAGLVVGLDPSDTSCTHGSVGLGDGRIITTKEGVRLKALREVIGASDF